MRFLTEPQIESIRERFGTPVYVYDQKTLEAAADQVLAFPAPCKLVGRFAMKALPTAAVAWLELAIDRWADLDGDVDAVLRAVWRPREVG